MPVTEKDQTFLKTMKNKKTKFERIELVPEGSERVLQNIRAVGQEYQGQHPLIHPVEQKYCRVSLGQTLGIQLTKKTI